MKYKPKHKPKMLIKYFQLFMIGLLYSSVSFGWKDSIVVHKFRTHDDQSDSGKPNYWVATDVFTTQSGTVVSHGEEIIIRAPRVVIGDSFHAQTGSSLRVGVPKLPIRCINMIDPVTAGQNSASNFFVGATGEGPTDDELVEFCKARVELLNAFYFNNGDIAGATPRKMIKFVYHSVLNWDNSFRDLRFYWDCLASPVKTYSYWCEDAGGVLAPGNFLHAYNLNEMDQVVGGSKAIQVILFNNPLYYHSGASANVGFDAQSEYPPYFLVEESRTERSDGQMNIGHVFDHELGHTFGLGHTRTKTPSANFMEGGSMFPASGMLDGCEAGGGRDWGVAMNPYHNPDQSNSDPTLEDTCQEYFNMCSDQEGYFNFIYPDADQDLECRSVDEDALRLYTQAQIVYSTALEMEEYFDSF